MKVKTYGSRSFRDLSCFAARGGVAVGDWLIYTDRADWGLSICAYL
jgi:hypothetical protein